MDVEVEQHDLLPRAQLELPSDHWHAQRRADEGGAQVGKAVIVAAGVVMVM